MYYSAGSVTDFPNNQMVTVSFPPQPPEYFVMGSPMGSPHQPIYYQKPPMQYQFWSPPSPPPLPQSPQQTYLMYPSTSYSTPVFYPEFQGPFIYQDSLSTPTPVSHEQILTGHVKDNCSVLKHKKHVQHRLLPIDQLHALLVPLKLTEAELEKEAYPLYKNNNFRVVKIAETQYTQNKKVFLKDYDLERTCSRCNKEFRLKPDGSMVREKDICRYHNRGVANNGKRDTFRKLYNCCNEEYNKAPGCKFSDVHVFDQLFERELTHFIATPPPLSPTDSRTVQAYAIDCEMVYTVSGPALARLSMVDMQGKMVLDVFIKPPNEVLDPNTEFSGLTMEQVQNAQDTMQSCHAKLFKFVNSETILIGHSLESDLKAMRLVHKSVVDTAILFKSPGDFKIALKNLSARFLNRTIQGDNEDAIGHDSLEDARTCVDLIYYGLKNPESLVFRKQS